MTDKSRQEKASAFRFSFLDHLLGEIATNSNQPRSQILAQLRANINRDLENLLNAKKRCLSLPEAFSEVEKSIINYGLPDFMSNEADSIAFFEELCPKIEDAINIYETRLTNVKVTCDKEIKNELNSRNIKFKITASLGIEPIDEPVTFEFMLKSESEAAYFNPINEN